MMILQDIIGIVDAFKEFTREISAAQILGRSNTVAQRRPNTDHLYAELPCWCRHPEFVLEGRLYVYLPSQR